MNIKRNECFTFANVRPPLTQRAILAPVVLLLAFTITPFAQAQRVAPAKLQANLLVKLLAFYTNLGTEPFSIHVVDSPTLAREFTKLVGAKVGNSVLEAVTSSKDPPENGAKVVYMKDWDDAVIKYTQENKCLSITGNPALVEQGVTLGVGVQNNKPKVMLNVTSGKAEGVLWNPAILRVAEAVN